MTDDCNTPVSPGEPEYVQLMLYSVPSTDLSSMEFVICTDTPESREILECPESALFSSTDPTYRSGEPDVIQTEDCNVEDEAFFVPEAMAEEEVVTVEQTDGETEIPSAVADCHPAEGEVRRLSEEWYFHPTKEEDIHPSEEEKLDPIKEYNYNRIKEKIMAEHKRRRKNPSHTPNLQNITLLHEDDDLRGREFISWEEFCRVFDAWCEKRKTLFFIKNATPLGKCQWRTTPLQPEVVDSLKYSSVLLLCKESKDAGLLGPGAMNRQKSCSAKITVHISQCKDCLVVTECRLSHNHVLCPIKFETYKKGYLLSNDCLPVYITNVISRHFLDLTDLKRLQLACPQEDRVILGILSALKNLFAKDPLSKVKLVFVEDTPMVQMVYFQTREMLRVCQYFPSALYFDRMVTFNDEFDLYTVLCVDGNERAWECAHCLARRGTPDILSTNLALLLQVMPELAIKVQSVTLGVDVDELNAIRQMLPCSKVQICRYQVLETLTKKARETGALYDVRARTLLCELVHSKSIDMYNLAVKKMNAVFSEQFMNYFWEQWHPRSALWAEFFQDCETCNAIKQQRQKLSWALRPSPNIAQCLLDLMATQGATVEVGCFNDKFVATRYRTICSVEQSQLIEEELVMANLRTYNIQENKMTFVLNDGISSFVMDRKLISCNCSIYTSKFLPCRHLFATRFRMGHALFDVNLLNKKLASSMVRR